MSITITSWNIQNFSSKGDDFAEKLDYIVSTIRALESDVVALQEILDEGALRALARELRFNYISGKPDRRSSRVGFLSRSKPLRSLPIQEWQLPKNEKVQEVSKAGRLLTRSHFPRPAHRITVQHKGAELDIVTAHLKSKLLTFKGKFSTTDETFRAQVGYFALKRRAAEVTSLRQHVTQLLEEGRRVVVLGDLNDGPEAATTQILYGASAGQPRGPEDAHDKLCAFQRPDKADPLRLFNVTSLVEEEIRWTRSHNGAKELLDHILCSEGLLPRNKSGLRVVPEMSILNGDVPQMHGSHPIAAGLVPDHAPVTAIFV